MAWKELQAEFSEFLREHEKKEISRDAFQYWHLRLLFEINGNLDSVAASVNTMRPAVSACFEQLMKLAAAQEQSAAATAEWLRGQTMDDRHEDESAKKKQRVSKTKRRR